MSGVRVCLPVRPRAVCMQVIYAAATEIRCLSVPVSVRDQDEEVEIIIARQKLAEKTVERDRAQRITRFRVESTLYESLGGLRSFKSLQRTDSGQSGQRRPAMSVILTASERTMQTTFHLRAGVGRSWKESSSNNNNPLATWINTCPGMDIALHGEEKCY